MAKLKTQAIAGGGANFMSNFTNEDKVAEKRQAALLSYRRGLDQQMQEKKVRDSKNKKEMSPDRVPYP